MKLAAAFLLCCSALPAQVAAPANADYRTAEGRARMANTLGAPGRAANVNAERIIESLDLKPGTAVADLGAGAGVMLPYLSRAVGSGGKVFAMDIFQDFLDKARAKAAEEKLSNVTFILGTDRDPKLPAACCDVILTVDAYHHFDYPADTLSGIRKALKPNGRFVVVDYYKRNGAMGAGPRALEHVRLDMDDAVKEIESNGFRKVSARDHVPGSQWIGVFTKSVQ